MSDTAFNLPDPAPEDLNIAAQAEIDAALKKAGENINASVLKAITRTIVPAIIGTLTALLLRAGIHVEIDANISELLGLIVTGAYYAAVTFAERKIHPAFGYLLGAKGTPRYVAKVK